MHPRSLVRERASPGQSFAFKKFQARPSAGAHKGDLIAQTRLVECLHAVAAANDALGAVLLRGFYDCAGDAQSPLGKARVFKNSHWAVPQNRLRLANYLTVSFDGS